jgi:hypothetical protein
MAGPPAGYFAAMTEPLTTVLDGRWAELKSRVRERMAATKPADTIGLDTESHRAQVLQQLHELAEAGYSKVSDDAGGSVISFQMLGYGDLSLMVKAGANGDCSAAPCRCSAPSGMSSTCGTSFPWPCRGASR